MKDSYRDGKIILNKEISKGIFKLELEGDFTGNPGQFYMIRGWNGLDPFLPRPISIADVEDGKLTLLYEVRGKGTHIISNLGVGEALSVLGPLGNGFEDIQGGRIALVSGGIGIAPLLYLAKKLQGEIDLFSGFRSEVYFLDEFKPYVSNIEMSTEDGSHGQKGFVTELFDPKDYDTIITCGPMPMMEALARICEDKTELWLSMESHMACGIGACLGCTIPTVRGMERVCKEGPVFNSREVVFND
ncbi:dihydroorotate dehydrogenase electron transfer subunit [Gudongella sp. DL1XJH-153]|uniref:dihydroorotate dehydrogenase electron transfer subunit n=1 Tax=Gudongella sp. DL1XJH-153 TaxID=3409804 RepID=UPI003BB63208